MIHPQYISFIQLRRRVLKTQYVPAVQNPKSIGQTKTFRYDNMGSFPQIDHNSQAIGFQWGHDLGCLCVSKA